MTDESSDPQKSPYEIGYKKPPKDTRFKPGESGNSRGRPRGAKNLATIVGNAIKEKVVITENGKRKAISKLEIAVKQLVNKAASGDQRATLQLIPLVQLVEGKNETFDTSPAATETDRATMESLNARLKQRFLNEFQSQNKEQPNSPKEEK